MSLKDIEKKIIDSYQAPPPALQRIRRRRRPRLRLSPLRRSPPIF